jgi:Ca2+-binding RTX toxin-like protein
MLLRVLKLDPGLQGADHAAATASIEVMSNLLDEGFAALGLQPGNGTDLTVQNMRDLSDWIRADPVRLETFNAAHGNDENGVETGFHSIVGNGGVTQLWQMSFWDMGVDGVCHLGFGHDGKSVINEDGMPMQSLKLLARAFDNFYAEDRYINTTPESHTKGGYYAGVYVGTEDDDLIKGKSFNDVLYGAGGDDTLRGGKHDDTVFGGEGNDSIFGGSGHDYLHGGEGDDFLKGSSGVDTFVFSGGNDTIRDFNSRGNDETLLLEGFDMGDATITFNGKDTLVFFDEDNSITLLGDDYTNVL